ncbi:type 4 prepilin-like proteins leader peptide-processing enzyme [Geomonas sp. Red276]
MQLPLALLASSQFAVGATIAFVLGAVVGSFLNVCIYRLPNHESVVFPPSHCPNCDYQIRWYDNVPIVSYLLLRGRCRGCGEHISLQYPIVELLNGLLTVALFWKFGLGLIFAIFFVYTCTMVVLTFIDLEHQILPDIITLPGIVAGFGISFLFPGFGWLNSLIGILAGGGSLLLIAFGYQLITKKDGMGGGDIKLLAMMGAFFGWQGVLFIIFVASLLGSVIGISVMLAQKKDSNLAIPFGPFLAGASLIFVFFGKRIIYWYLHIGS